MRVPVEVVITIKYNANDEHYDGNIEETIEQELLEGALTLDEFVEVANIERIDVRRLD